MPRLIAKLPGGPKTIPLGDEALTIGRTNDNKLPLDNDGVSRKHAQILFVGKGYEVVDLGSRNGTKVNGQKVPRAILKAGDVVHIGGIDLVFEEDAPAGGGGSSGLEVEEFDLGAAAAGAPAAINASPTQAFMVPGAPPAGECVVRIIDGERKGTEVPLKGPRTTFGRRSSNTVSFTDAGVSGVHCEISREPNGYVLRDLGSTNGTVVDGEPVVETLLRHNSRIRIGAQRMVFVDPTVADIESTLATGDDAAEWGLMRGEIDVTASRGRGGGTALLVSAAVVAAAAGAGWYVFQNAPKRVQVAEVKDNRVADFSFEEESVRWFSPEEEGAKVRVLGSSTAPRGASGIHSLEVLPAGEGPGVVEYSVGAGGGEATVSPDAVYELSAKVGGGTGAVVVVWTAAAPGLVREVATPLVEGGGSWPATRAVVAAPAGAAAARIRLLAGGGRPATFDDIVFRRAEGAAPPALESGELRVRIDAGGFLECVRGSEILLTQGGLAPSVDVPVDALLGASLAAAPAHSGATLSASGTLPGGQGFDVSATAVGGGAVLTCVPKGGAGAFTVTGPGALARGAVTLVLEKSAVVVPEAETYKSEGVRKVIVGTSESPNPFVLSAPEGSAGFTFTSRRTSRGLRMQFAPPAGAAAEAAGVRLSVDLTQETKAADVLMREARDAESNGKMGTAAARYERVALEFHYLPVYREPAGKAAKTILDNARRRIEDAKREALGARRFRSVTDLERLLNVTDKLHKEFEDHVTGVQAKELHDAVAKDLDGVRLEEVEHRVEMLYRRAADYKDAGKPALRLILMEEMLRVAPEGNEVRAKIDADIQGVRAEVEEQQRKAFTAGK